MIAWALRRPGQSCETGQPRKRRWISESASGTLSELSKWTGSCFHEIVVLEVSVAGCNRMRPMLEIEYHMDPRPPTIDMLYRNTDCLYPTFHRCQDGTTKEESSQFPCRVPR